MSLFDNDGPVTPRIALYSHDTMGLGHFRRNLVIGQALALGPLHADILLITGTPIAAAFSVSHRISRLILPSLHKEIDGVYRPDYSGVSLRGLIDFRSLTIRSAIEEFDPDILIVDKVARGALRELDLTLEFLRGRGKTQCILGLRDILDDPEIVRKEWQNDAVEDAIREYYDYIWVYGDPAIYDTVQEYQLPRDLAEMVFFTGYLDQRRRSRHFVQKELTPSIVCFVGGGQDGTCLAETFAQCQIPNGLEAVLVSGPFMPRNTQRRLARSAKRNRKFKVFDFVPDPTPLLINAAKVIAMGGYNTMCEVLSFEKTALIVPRVVPRREQLIRAERMKEKGFIDILNWEEVTPQALTNWLQIKQAPPNVHGKIDFRGLERIPQYVQSILAYQEPEIQSIM